MKGILIIVDGLNGSGKQTQTEMLVGRLIFDGYKSKRFDFPQYESESGKLIKRYLKGEFGENGAVNPYLASLAYAIDRKMTYENEIKPLLDEGYVIICDRYTTSNMLHQTAYFETEEKKNEYLDWLLKYEYEYMKIPKPDEIIMLMVEPQITVGLMKDRNEKDIHEDDIEYIKRCYNTAHWLKDKYSWKSVNCVADGQMRSRKDITDELYKIIQTKIQEECKR